MLKTVSSITNAIGALNYKGTWNANTNNPALASGVGTKGDYYVVGTAGTTTLDGISNWGIGDWAVFNGSVWQRVEGGADLNGVNLSVSGTSTLSGLTASTALALNAQKEIVSVTNTGSGSNVLATSPALVTPILGTPQSGDFSTGTFTWPTFNQNTTGSSNSLKSNATTGLLQVTGPAAGQIRVMTTPDANFTAARTDAAQTFTGLQTFVESVNFDGTGGAPSSAEITRSINAGYAVASARGNWVKAAAVGGAQYSAYKNGSNNDYLVWDLVLENCSQIVCGFIANNQADGTSRTISSEYSTDGGATWTALGSATFGSSGGTSFGGTITFNAPNSLIYLKVRAFWSSGATSSDLIGIRGVTFTPTCTNHSFAKSLG